MPDLTLYRDDLEERLIPALTIAAARYERQGMMGFADECDKLKNKLFDRLSQGLHPKREGNHNRGCWIEEQECSP